MYAEAAQDIIEGREPSLPSNPEAFRVRSVSAVLHREVPFEDGLPYMVIPAEETLQISPS
jgi:hypothetical protein